MLPFTINKSDCTGCSACYAVCPVKCIEMKQDAEGGFLYPVASDRCVHCNRCEQVCPQLKENPIKVTEQEAFALCTKDMDVWKRSASGGAFSEICRAFGDADTLFVGAAWDGFAVRHIGAVGFENIGPLCKSKYIASDMGDVFLQIREHLIGGHRAVFCGTPCQVAGLRAFLGKEYENLLLIDLICHGVGSPAVFNTCIEVMEDSLGEKIQSYEFRTKRDIIEIDYLSKVVTDKHSEGVYLVKDPYMDLFLKQNCTRPSCSNNCKYRDSNRQGDITIADMKRLALVFPSLAGSKVNYSTVITNNEKGKRVVSGLVDRTDMRSCDIEQVKKYNPLFWRHTQPAVNRDAFFEDYAQDPKRAVKKWAPNTVVYKKKLMRRAYDALPTKIRGALWRLAHRA